MAVLKAGLKVGWMVGSMVVRLVETTVGLWVAH